MLVVISETHIKFKLDMKAVQYYVLVSQHLSSVSVLMKVFIFIPPQVLGVGGI